MYTTSLNFEAHRQKKKSSGILIAFVSAIYCCIKNYPKTYHLKQHLSSHSFCGLELHKKLKCVLWFRISQDNSEGFDWAIAISRIRDEDTSKHTCVVCGRWRIQYLVCCWLVASILCCPLGEGWSQGLATWALHRVAHSKAVCFIRSSKRKESERVQARQSFAT